MVSPGTSVKPTHTFELPIYFSSNIPPWQQCKTLSKFKKEILKNKKLHEQNVLQFLASCHRMLKNSPMMDSADCCKSFPLSTCKISYAFKNHSQSNTKTWSYARSILGPLFFTIFI